MKIKRFGSLGDFARRAPAMLLADSKALAEQVQFDVGRNAMRDAIASTPRGSSKAAAERVRRHGDPVYGHMAGRWFYVVGDGTKSKQLRKVRLGEKTRVVNDAAHARVVDSGRRRSKPYTRGGKGAAAGEEAPKTFSRMLGSPAAPRGIGRPVVERAESREAQTIKRAIAKVER